MIIIGDCHGNFKTLLALIAQFPKDQKIVIVGDLIDRGPKSKEVVQYVIDNNIDCVKGNHEQMMVDEGLKKGYSGIWLRNGGEQTLDSYKDASGEIDLAVFNAHRKWMEELPLILAYENVKNDEGRMLVVSHSSCGKVWEWDEQRREEQSDHFENIVMWGRDVPKGVDEIYNVFGHTPQKDGPRINKPWANVDTGCYVSANVFPGYSKLTALQYPEMKVYSQENIDHEI